MSKFLISKRFKYYPLSNKIINLSEIQIGTKRQVEEKINKGIYKFEDVPCFCGSNIFLTIAERDRYGLWVNTVVCIQCGLMATNPRMTLDSYKQFYNSEYRRLYGERDHEKDKLWLAKVNQGKKVYEFITQNLSMSSGVVLEIGCNMGATLYVFHQNGFDVAGVDYGSENIEFGRIRSELKNLYVGGIEKLKAIGIKADLVILQHVLEHFFDLDTELKDIREIMKSTGYIYVEVPGIYWWIHHICRFNLMGLLQNAHTYHFSLTTLTYVMECAGFELIVSNEMIKSIFRRADIFRDKRNLPNNECRKTINYLKRMEICFGILHFGARILDFFRLKKFIKQIFRL